MEVKFEKIYQAKCNDGSMYSGNTLESARSYVKEFGPGTYSAFDLVPSGLAGECQAQLELISKFLIGVENGTVITPSPVTEIIDNTLDLIKRIKLSQEERK